MLIPMKHLDHVPYGVCLTEHIPVSVKKGRLSHGHLTLKLVLLPIVSIQSLHHCRQLETEHRAGKAEKANTIQRNNFSTIVWARRKKEEQEHTWLMGVLAEVFMTRGRGVQGNQPTQVGTVLARLQGLR